MRGGKHLLLLGAFMVLTRCQQLPRVSMSPNFKDLGIFSGDLFYLRCENSATPVKWYFNNTEQPDKTNKTLKITVAHHIHAGIYQCESNGQKSSAFSIGVREYLPHASLTIKTGQPVMQPGGSIILQLENEGGLQGWNCWVYRGVNASEKKIVLRLKNAKDSSIVFQPNRLRDPETTFWCTDSTRVNRSNQITVRTSEKQVSLEMYPLPPVAGESVTLRCLVWGTDQISRAVFYQNNTSIAEGPTATYNINQVKESHKGSYKCFAQFKYIGHTAGSPYEVTSDDQYVYIQVPPIKAVLSYSGDTVISCSCSLHYNDTVYHWYYKKDQSWTTVGFGPASMKPPVSGTYACRAVWKNGRSSLSNTIIYESAVKPILIWVIIVLVILILAAVVFYIWYKKRNTRGPIYEDVALKSRVKGDDKYETLQKTHGAQREAEYDTLNPEAAGREKKEGEYEPLKQEGMKEGVHHTLGTEGAAGGEGGYEALKKEGMKEGAYHTLGTEGAAGGEGGYEALKKQGMKEGVYHTLGTEGAAGGEGGYEALKKQGMKEGVYHTLGTEGAAGGEGGYEALKKQGMKEGVYHTLGTEGAAGGEGGYEALKKQGMKEGVYHTLGTEGATGGEGGHEAEGKDDKDKAMKENEEVKAD